MPGVTPAPARRRLSSGAIAGIVVGGLAVLVLLLGILAAIAIPVFLNQQREAYDSAARADALQVGIHVAGALVEAPDDSIAVGTSGDGTAYVISGSAGEVSRVERSEGVVFEYAVVDPEAAWFCVQTRALEGSAGPVHYSSWTGLGDGPCS